MQIYLIRHGQTTGDVEKRYGGDYDDHLTEEGRRQSQLLAEQLTDQGIKMIFHSPLIRAAETAQMVAEYLHCPWQKTEALRERNTYGILSGMTQEEALRNYPDQVKVLKDVNKTIVQGAESYEIFRARFLQGFEQITASADHNVVGIVTHGGPIRCLLREKLEGEELKHLGDCAYFLLEKDDHGLRLISMHNASYE